MLPLKDYQWCKFLQLIISLQLCLYIDWCWWTVQTPSVMVIGGGHRGGPSPPPLATHQLRVSAILASKSSASPQAAVNCHWDASKGKKPSLQESPVLKAQLESDREIATSCKAFWIKGQLSNLRWMPNSVSKGFDTAMKTGSSRRLKRYPTIIYVNFKLTSLYCGLRIIPVYPNPQ